MIHAAVVLALFSARSDIVWQPVDRLGVEGQGFKKTESRFDRLPADAESRVRPAVWRLSQHSAGLAVRFVTDAPEIHVRWTLRFEPLAMPHMPATGVSGIDLYVRTDSGKWRWLAIGKPTKYPTNTARLVSGLSKERREFLMYLPLYNGVSSCELGVPRAAHIAPAPERPKERQRPIVFYGTSITQGGCASRPGMVHTAILGRRFERPVINLGFSGNGTLDAAIADCMARIDAAVFVIDCLPNLRAEQVAERIVPFVERLRRARPRTPILLVEDRSYSHAFLVESARRRNTKSRAALRAGFDRLQKEGVGELYYLEGAGLLGDDGDSTVDGSHPNDLGFSRQAEVMARALQPVLDQQRER